MRLRWALCALLLVARLWADDGDPPSVDEPAGRETVIRPLPGGAADVGFAIPFAYGAQVSDQYQQVLGMHWTIGPVNAEWWKFDLALESDFFTGAGKDLLSFFIQPLVGSFTAAIRFTPVDGFYLEYVHNSAHTLQPLAPPTIARLNYYPTLYTTSDSTALVGLLDFFILGLRSRVWDLALGIGRKTAFTSVDGVLLPFYQGQDSGPMLLSLFSYGEPMLLARLRLDLGLVKLGLLHLNGFHLVPKVGKAYMGLSAREGVNRPGRMGYAALAVALAPIYFPPYHTLDGFVSGGLSYGLYDPRRMRLDFAPLWHISVGVDYRLLIPGVRLGRPGKFSLTAYSNGEGEPLPE